jgi:hypothetical protein
MSKVRGNTTDRVDAIECWTTPAVVERQDNIFDFANNFPFECKINQLFYARLA